MEGGVGENRQDVLEEDAFRWEVGELAQSLPQARLKTGEFGGAGGGGGGDGGGDARLGGFWRGI